MTKVIAIDENKIERFAISFLKKKGYLVYKIHSDDNGEEEASVVKYFYNRAREKLPESFSNVVYSGFEIDVSILRKVINKIDEYGLSYKGNLKVIKTLIDYLFDNPTACGGPYTSFKIFSSESFLENLIKEYDRHRYDHEDKSWDKTALEDSKLRKTDYISIRDDLLNLKGRLENGKI